MELDNGMLLTESIAIMQYLALLSEEQNLIAPLTSFDFFKQEEWLAFISSELHKMFSPWLFHPEYGSDAQRVATQKIYARFNYIDAHLAESSYLVGDQFSLCDIYLFTIARWSSLFEINLAPYPRLPTYLERIAKRPAVQAAIETESPRIDKSSPRTWSGQDASDLMG
ncbi:glutathione binding-like protein [Salinisphaera sp. RV14]|uniref:glutathione binding-like protein n=1 Tax=Salinisphaera sp. RV14 TaxID=3454140 RepID=UPI003F86D214